MEIKKEEHIFVVLAHSDSVRKADLLNQCLDSLSRFGFQTVLVSHYPETQEAISKSNIFLFQKENPLLLKKDYQKYGITHSFWYENNESRIETIYPFIHDFATFLLIKSGVIIAESLGASYIHVLNYDNIIEVENFKEHFIQPLERYDLSYSMWSKIEKHLMATYAFSFRVGTFDKLLNSIETEKDYFQNRICGWQLERLFKKFVIDNNINYVENNYPKKLLDILSIKKTTNLLNQILLVVDSSFNKYLLVCTKDNQVKLNIVGNSLNTFLIIESNTDKIIKLSPYVQNETISVYESGRLIFKKILDETSENFFIDNKIIIKNENEEKILFEIKNSYKIGMTQVQEEIYEFAKLVLNSKVKNFLEIGTDRGGNFVLLCALSNKNGIKISIDIPFGKFGENNFDKQERNKILLDCPGIISLFEIDSHSDIAFRKASDSLNGQKLDLLFIDGDHTYDGVKKDYEMFSPLVQEGGLIVFHDIVDSTYHNSSDCGVARFWKELDGEKIEFIAGRTWGGIGVIKKREIKFIYPKVNFHFINGAHIELTDGVGNFHLTLKNNQTNEVLLSKKIQNNDKIQFSKTYFIDYKIEIIDEDTKQLIFDYNLNYTNERVYIHIDSNALGDTLAWFPYIEKFQQKHQCKIICSTFFNWLFEDLYPKIEFVKPGSIVHNILGMYEIGIFDKPEDRNPIETRNCPLQKISSDILGLEYQELTSRIVISNRKIQNQPIKYVCICTESTARAKLWNNPLGWREVIKHLTELGFQVIHLGKETESKEKNVINIKNQSLDDIILWLLESQFFVGLSSGLSWLSNALGKKVVMISGCTAKYNEFKFNNYRVESDAFCKECFNDTKYRFDKSFEWCPAKKNFICSSSITSDMVIKKINQVIQEL